MVGAWIVADGLLRNTDIIVDNGAVWKIMDHMLIITYNGLKLPNEPILFCS